MLSRSYMDFRMEPKPFAALAGAQAAAKVFKEYVHRHYRSISGNHLAVVLMALGRHDEGAALLRELMSEAQRFHEPFYATMATLNLVVGLSALESSEAAEQAVSLGRPIMAAAGTPAALLYAAQPYFAEALSIIGAHEEAEQVARQAQEALKGTPLYHVMGYTSLARILLQRDRMVAARETAEEGLVLIKSLGGCGYMEVPLRLVLAEARRAAGDAAAAEEALRDAVAQLRLRADGAPDAEARARYLFAVPAHARLCALSEQWLGERVT
jgi:eukaryotic-like serine/threonine-protein kinase